MNVADLFAGVGGMSEGFRMAGFDIKFAIEFDKDIAQAFANNHIGTEVISEDICNVDAKALHEKYPKIDVIMGGPPCQGFSQKGKRLNLDDPRNFLFHQFVRFVGEFNPKYFVLENVPNIVPNYFSFGIKITDEELKNMLERASENGEGLTFDEFCKVMIKQQ